MQCWISYIACQRLGTCQVKYCAHWISFVKSIFGKEDIFLFCQSFSRRDEHFQSIEHTVQAASKLVGLGLRTFGGRVKLVMLTLMKSLVQPKLDYCSHLWSPSDQGSINKMEASKRHLAGRIKDTQLAGLNYQEKLGELHLYSQERRREIPVNIYLDDEPGDGLWL